jgi:hypothetical protein
MNEYDWKVLELCSILVGLSLIITVLCMTRVYGFDFTIDHAFFVAVIGMITTAISIWSYLKQKAIQEMYENGLDNDTTP